MTIFDNFVQECSELHFLLSEGFIIRCIVAIITGQCRFETISKIPIERIKEAWISARKGLEFSINFVRREAGIESSTIISSPYALIPIAAYAATHDFKFGKEGREFLYWFYEACMWGHYGRGYSREHP